MLAAQAPINMPASRLCPKRARQAQNCINHASRPSNSKPQAADNPQPETRPTHIWMLRLQRVGHGRDKGEMISRQVPAKKFAVCLLWCCGWGNWRRAGLGPRRKHQGLQLRAFGRVRDLDFLPKRLRRTQVGGSPDFQGLAVRVVDGRAEFPAFPRARASSPS